MRRFVEGPDSEQVAFRLYFTLYTRRVSPLELHLILSPGSCFIRLPSFLINASKGGRYTRRVTMVTGWTTQRLLRSLHSLKLLPSTRFVTAAAERVASEVSDGVRASRTAASQTRNCLPYPASTCPAEVHLIRRCDPNPRDRVTWSIQVRSCSRVCCLWKPHVHHCQVLRFARIFDDSVHMLFRESSHREPHLRLETNDMGSGPTRAKERPCQLGESASLLHFIRKMWEEIDHRRTPWESFVRESVDFRELSLIMGRDTKLWPYARWAA